MYSLGMAIRTRTSETEQITPAVASEITGLSASHLARMADAGRIHCTRPSGTHRRYVRSEIEALMEPQQRQETSS